MKSIASIAIGLFASFLAQGWAVENLDFISRVACSDAFTLPALACRFGGVAVTLLLVPVAGAVAYLLASLVFGE